MDKEIKMEKSTLIKIFILVASVVVFLTAAAIILTVVLKKLHAPEKDYPGRGERYPLSRKQRARLRHILKTRRAAIKEKRNPCPCSDSEDDDDDIGFDVDFDNFIEE